MWRGSEVKLQELAGCQDHIIPTQKSAAKHYTPAPTGTLRRCCLHDSRTSPTCRYEKRCSLSCIQRMHSVMRRNAAFQRSVAVGRRNSTALQSQRATYKAETCAPIMRPLVSSSVAPRASSVGGEIARCLATGVWFHAAAADAASPAAVVPRRAAAATAAAVVAAAPAEAAAAAAATALATAVAAATVVVTAAVAPAVAITAAGVAG